MWQIHMAENQVISFDFWISKWRITFKVHALSNGKSHDETWRQPTVESDYNESGYNEQFFDFCLIPMLIKCK